MREHVTSSEGQHRALWRPGRLFLGTALVVAVASSSVGAAALASGRPTATAATTSTLTGGLRAAPTYTFKTIRLPQSIDSQITGINTAGVFTGQAIFRSGSSSITKNFVESSRVGSKPVYFTIPFAAEPLTAVTAGIDNSGEIVGDYADTNGVFHGFIRSPKGVFTKFNVAGAGTAPHEGTEIAGISPQGIIVGSFIGARKFATGFIDNGTVKRYREPGAGTGAGDGTSVDFFPRSGEFGGLFIDNHGAAKGWYSLDGKVHVLSDPASGPAVDNTGTQLFGIGATGRLYGVEAPGKGSAESFTYKGGLFRVLRDPRQAKGPKSGTLILTVNSAGTIAGFYVYDAAGQRRAFIARQVH
jgi:hypothetical protein